MFVGILLHTRGNVEQKYGTILRMKKILVSLSALLVVMGVSVAQVSASSATITALSPGGSVMAKNKLSFSVLTSGFTATSYQFSDSFANSTATVNNFDGGGNFSWVPIVSDVGTHTFSITSHDYNGNEASVTQTITVLPPPSVTIQSVSPSGNIMPGTKVIILIAQSGFTNPAYTVGDEFSGSSVGNALVNSSGSIVWTPDASQNGPHRITVYASDTLGHSGTANVDVQVGAGPRLVIQLTSTSTTIAPGQFISFNVAPVDFTPTGYSLVDEFNGTKSSITNTNISSNGAFYWIPQASDAGVHKIKILGQVGAFGDKASSTQVVTVIPQGGVLPIASNTTAVASSTLLSTLQAQLAALMTKIPAHASEPATSHGHTFSLNLKPGSRSDEVMELQKVLVTLGLLTAKPNGYFGVGTTAAVKKFQELHGLDTLGSVGPATRAALNALNTGSATNETQSSTGTTKFVFEHFMGYGDDESDVLQLQARLKDFGYLPQGTPLGFYGTATEIAVKKFQAAHGLPELGYCNKATRDALNK
jgi:peptidoglycan hydrolase-like protein with peptidoglycan-binding domain